MQKILTNKNKENFLKIRKCGYERNDYLIVIYFKHLLETIKRKV